jgi:N-acetylmuramic acid 6-phosphate (MurNAc-6-P) etherase
MSIELEKIDLIRNRTGVSYREAKKALDEAGGDVIEALITLEETDRSFTGAMEPEEFTEKVQGRTQDIIEQIKSVLQRGQYTRIKVKQGDRIVFEMPATMGALGVLAVLASSELAILGALGTATAMAKNYTLEIEHRYNKGTEEHGQAAPNDTFTIKNPPMQ